MPKPWKKELRQRQSLEETPEEREQHTHEAAMLAAEIGDEAPSLDLHGMIPRNAIYSVEEFIDREFMKGTEAVRIIHGRGTNALRKAVWELLTALKTKGIVAAYRDATYHKQQGAVTLVALHHRI